MRYIIILIILSCSTNSNIVNYNDSNVALLNSAINSLNLFDKIKDKIPQNASIFITDQLNEDEDSPIQSSIRDYIVSSFIENKISIIEYDSNIISASIKERKFNTNYHSTQFILAYRVIECGIFTQDLNDKMAQREALVRLSIRLIDARTLKIIEIRNVASIRKDEVSKDILPFLEDYKYSNYPKVSHEKDFE
jgi:hypothetical protein